MKFKLLLLSLIIAHGLVAQSNKGTIKGSVKTSDGAAAAFVTVSLQNTNKGSTANYKGEYELRNIEAGSYVLIASFVGLESKEVNVIVTAGQTTNVQEIVLTESAQELEQVVISASRDKYNTDKMSSSLRLKSSLLETPQNIQVVTPEVLRDQQVISMSDGLIRNVAGTVRSEHWGDLYANISSRGSQIQAFRNGFNVVNSYWGPLTEDMSFVDHIEFVKGPAGFMLSSGDPSGLYNIVTKKPTGQTKGEASITAGSFGLFRTTLDLDGKLERNGKLLYRLNVSGQNKNSFRQNEYNDRYVIAPVIAYQVDEKTKLTLEYNYQRANMSNIGSFYMFSRDGFAAFPVDATTLPAGTPGVKINDHSVYVNVNHELNENWSITGQVGHFRYDQIGHSMWPSIMNEDGTYVRNIGIWDAKSKMTMAQVFLNGEVQTGPVRHRILGGLDIASKEYMADWSTGFNLDSADNPFDPTNPRLGVPITGYPNFDRSQPLEQRAQQAGGLQSQRYTSVYVQDELGFIDNKLRVTLAGRFTDLQQSAWGGAPDKAKHFTPRMGVSATVTKQTSVYALYDQAFVPQTGTKTDGTKVQPITGNNMELGVKKTWFNGWTTTLSAYRILKNNELAEDPSNRGKGLSIEYGQKRAQGIEFDLRGTLAAGLNLIANYAYTDSRINKSTEGVTEFPEGSLVPGFAKHTGNIWLTYKIQGGTLKGLGFSAGYTALLDRATYWTPAPDPDKEMEDYFKMDAGMFWESNRLRITANVFNVLNTYLYSGSYEMYMYDANGQQHPVYSYQAEAPRNTRLSISYRF